MKKYIIACSLIFFTLSYSYGQSSLETTSIDSEDNKVTTNYQLTETKRVQVETVFEKLLNRLDNRSIEYKMQTLSKLQMKIHNLLPKIKKQYKLNILNYLNQLVSDEISSNIVQVETLTDNNSASNTKADLQTVYIIDIYTLGGNNYIKATSIGFYTGDNAAKIIEEKDPKGCERLKQEMNQEKCYPMNDYYIVTTDIEQELLIANDVKVIMQTYSIVDGEISWNEEVSYSDFVLAIKEGKTKGDFDMSYDYVPFHLEIVEDKITTITEQYIP
ncbi:MAG: hypothetical protein V3575_02410 [Candidatus Absconditabacteria bacterium]